MVRSGQGSFLLHEFLDKGICALGWNETGKISRKTKYKDLKKRLQSSYPEFSPGRLNQSSGQMWRFIDEIKEGHNIVTYDTDSRCYYFGEIISDYGYNTSYKFHHFRKVEWNEYPIDRDQLTPESKNILGSILTLFEIPEQVFNEIRAAHPGYISEEEFAEQVSILKQHEDESIKEFEKEQEDRIREEVVARSIDFIQDSIAELDSNQIEKLVAGILTAMGYKSRLTPKVRDLGSDIHASPDGLGMLEPRIKAEVKHKSQSKEKVSAPELRNFIGGLRNIEKGIYVSTTGFTQDAKYEAERANFPITLVDFELLAELLVDNYETLAPEVKALVPLRKIYWPI